MRHLPARAALIAVMACGILRVPAWSAAAAYRNVILIGWDGTDRRRLSELRSEGLLPNLDRLIAGGSLVDTDITTGGTQTKPGWSEILTGLSSVRLGIPSNKEYQPIAKGLTIFERLKAQAGAEATATIFLAGKSHNVGIRGPHEICLNARTRDPKTHMPTHYQERKRFTGLTEDGKPPLWVRREGEPFFNAQTSIDTLEQGLGFADQVGARALEVLEEYKGRRFFAFFHFADPDETGHRFGEDSAQYRDAIRAADLWLGRILDRLKDLGLMDKTVVYVTADHGMDEKGFQHDHAPHTFVATDSRRKLHAGDRKDVAPTLLLELGITTDSVHPPLDGQPLTADAGPLPAAPAETPLRVGYFLGGRTNILMRVQEAGNFSRLGLDVQLLGKSSLRGKDYFPLDSDLLKKKDHDSMAKSTGPELVQGVLDGSWELATIGESSFMISVAKGEPIVAVAELGYDVKGNSGHLFALRDGVEISTAADYRGKLFISRRAGPGDAAFLMEYLAQEGVDLKNDVNIVKRLPLSAEEKAKLPKDKVNVVHKVYEDEMAAALEKGLIDGGYFHLRPFEAMKGLRPVRTLHTWANPELSLAVVVCREDFLKVKSNRDRVKLFIRAYMERNRLEKTLPLEKRRGRHAWRGLDSPTPGMNYPQYPVVPTVRTDLLYDMLALLRKHEPEEWPPQLLLEPHIDNSLVKEVDAELPPFTEPAPRP